ncbi:Cyclic nucleotide-binding domain-containing protein [Streptomyces sp. WMMB 714]|uniref:cyclic nucleotide-binding domain-containing protein n=1 Tax=Streptomyces sp. WMMB 714 TaxID=1286822 RepID=UPI0005F865A6|nr:cyclic nucleotide-binding domain-containing protein [Streptomyces sp. WMMB 714]SCK11400.1 Cyclic nucleotide-binding domain-containing protein [Streptomyces sp. WMMB 714]
MTTARPRLLSVLPAPGYERMMEHSHEVRFAKGTRIFEEGRSAHCFWIVRSGTVDLDLHVPGRQPVIVESLHAEDLLGWSWLFRPHVRTLGASAFTSVGALEFDARAVRALCDEDPELGRALNHCVAEIIAGRLIAARWRLLDLYGPQGSGPRP